jgi:hypothetical protein
VATVISGSVPAVATVIIAVLLARAGHLTLRINWERGAPGGHIRVVPRHAEG